MAKVTAESREAFSAKMQPYKDSIDKIFEKEKNITALMAKDKAGNSYKRMLLAEDMIYITTLYVLINNLSVEILSMKNMDALNEGRKTLYKAIIYLEETVSNLIDAPYSEYEDKLAEISNIPLNKRYELTRKLGLAIRLIIDAYGDNTKWRWSFTELQGRFATVAKNMIDMKAATKIYFDPRNPDYDTAVYYFRLIKKLLGESADGYRDRYELSTRRLDDIRLGINYLIALRRVQIALSETEDAEETKKKAVVWKSKMDTDQKKGISN
ncbi:hypothetical protein H0R92_07405 [Treponema sp. OMZ 840]|uniref:hypothetical protein n=1 Tax=Treponema sp. OMZ 840 TaxID=244313 RepID=UPI003D908EA0